MNETNISYRYSHGPVDESEPSKAIHATCSDISISCIVELPARAARDDRGHDLWEILEGFPCTMTLA